MIAPTIACVVETGNQDFVIIYTANPAETQAANAPGNALIDPNFPTVSVVPAPLMTAPNIINNPHTMAAVLNRIIRVPTAVPKTFAASLAPKDQPRNNPPKRKITITKSMNYLNRSFDSVDLNFISNVFSLITDAINFFDKIAKMHFLI